jgi:FkbH-like protein
VSQPGNEVEGITGWGSVNLIEALETLKKPALDETRCFRAFLACGFVPLHLHTFLRAQFREVLAGQSVKVEIGLFGDLAGSIEKLHEETLDALAVVIEWQDLDPRLGVRGLGGWRTEDFPDIMESSGRMAVRLEKALHRASLSMPVCVCMPTLPLPPAFATPPTQAGSWELQLRQLVGSLAVSLSEKNAIRVVSLQALDEISPPHTRLDVASELASGFPYRLPHASAIAGVMANLIQRPVPKKGLITDLDDTLWAGILGEIGPEAVSWHIDQKNHIHGLYQRFLSSLASAGVLIAVASKNDRDLVSQAFRRDDIGITGDSIYPFEVNWSRKSESVRRILKAWNIDPEAVIFIDDSPMEIAEVQAAFPRMECIAFPAKDSEATWNLLKHLRDRFGKSVLSKEDTIRLKSLRGASAFIDLDANSGSLDDFLRDSRARVRVSFAKKPGDARALELINKTNQFNLNGRRLSDAVWLGYLNDSSSFLMSLDYEDKFGPLGKVAVLLGKIQEKTLRVESWVMSCRAFSRRIEYQMVRQAFEKFDAETIYFDFQATPRNRPLQEFLASLKAPSPSKEFSLSRSECENIPINLFHSVEEAANG